MDNNLLPEWLSSASSNHSNSFIMDGDELSVPDTPETDFGSSSPEESAMDRQLAILQTHLDSLPYRCESVEEMQVKLEFIVLRIDVCVRSKNWTVLTTWDSMLQGSAIIHVWVTIQIVHIWFL